MSSLPILILILLVVFLSTLVRAAFGFGNALIAMPLLVLLIGIKVATPLVGLVGLVIAVIMLVREWRKLVIKDALILMAASLAGIPLGLMLLTGSSEGLAKIILGLILIGFGLYNLMGIKIPVLKNQALAIPFGFFAGILGGAFNANGPPIVVYGLMRGWKKEEFRATLQGYFLISSLLIVGGHGLSGLWSRQVFYAFLASLPVIFLAVYMGDKLTLKISQEIFNKTIYFFLIIMGILMFL